MSILSSPSFALQTLFVVSPEATLWHTILVWLLRILTLSFVFRTFLGPYLLRLVSKRLRVRSISLRSIRGIFFQTGGATVRVDRVGLSYHRPSPEEPGRFSIKVEGFKLHLRKVLPKTADPPFSPTPDTPNIMSVLAELRPTPLGRRLRTFAGYLLSKVYFAIDPYLRPVVRSCVVGVLRFAIHGLPALTQALYFELDFAMITSDCVPGSAFVIQKAKLTTNVKLSQLEGAEEKGRETGHRRFSSVVQWNARFTNSLRRTWDRAWGSTEVSPSLSLDIEGIRGESTDGVSELLQHVGHDPFFNVPALRLSTSATLDPHHGIQHHSLDVGVEVDSITVKLDQLLRIAKEMSTKSECAEDIDAEHANGRPVSPSSVKFTPSHPAFASVLSASMRFRRNLKRPPVRRLNSHVLISRIAALKSIQVNISRVTVKQRIEIGEDQCTLSTTLRSINVNTALSHSDRNPLHREWLGRADTQSDALCANVYEFGFSMRELAVDRIRSAAVSEHLRIIGIGPITLEAVASQWPAPWLCGPNFLTGDPNAQVLLVQVSIDKIEMTERLEVIQFLLRAWRPKPDAKKSSKPITPVVSRVPRVQFGIHIGEICTRLISPTLHVDGRPFALETRSKGLICTAYSHFTAIPDSHPGKQIKVPDCPRLCMDFGFHLTLHPVFVYARVGLHHELTDRSGDAACHLGESILSLDGLQVEGNGQALGNISEVPGIVVSIDMSSLFLQAQVASDALSIELWQPDVIRALAATFGSISASVDGADPKPPSKRKEMKLSGVDVTFSIARVMVYVTSRDLSPDDELNLSRGIACHAGISAHYCALTAAHLERRPRALARREDRLKLSLPDELVAHAYGRTITPDLDRVNAAVFAQTRVRNFAVRDTVATPVVADDPYGIGDMNEDHRRKEYFHIDNIVADVILSGAPVPSSKQSAIITHCQVTVDVSGVRAKLQLANIYSLLLAAQTLRTIFPPGKPESRRTSDPSLSIGIAYQVDKVQLLLSLPLKSKLYARVRSISGNFHSSEDVSVRWKSMILATSVESIKDGNPYVHWEEIARLLNFTVDAQLGTKPIPISVAGTSCRLRIPFDFVLADLILNINVSIKSIKHLVHMIPSGLFSNPPSPEAEDAKIVPNLTLQVGCLVVEAADEDIESRLGLIWRAGFEAARLRQERDEAFQAKVATIVAAEQHEASAVDSNFQFSSEHTVSIAEARERLDRLHSSAWKSQFRQAHAHQRRKEQAQVHAAGGDIPLYGAEYEDLVPVTAPDHVPPLFRLTWEKLKLKLSGPSFPMDDIPEFLFKEGDGLPLDTQYSLLIPLHLNFAVASLRLAYREYPLPLLNIPSHSTQQRAGLEFDGDIVIAEEMGTDQSVQWVECTVLDANTGLHGASSMVIPVPKTIMPVKSYAKPVIRVMTDGISDFAWGCSYAPATQDFMRVIDTISHAPRDESPPIGFWDKIRLVFHWRFKVDFNGDVHFHMKGSRDPYDLRGAGAGFALCWRGQPKLLIGQPNEQKELIQVISDSMFITIPNIEASFSEIANQSANRTKPSASSQKQFPRYQKVCAKLTSGVRFGVGIALERSCGPECPDCHGRPFQRRCRLFTFRPHYEVMLERKHTKPELKSAQDSYNGFRSDFIHLSISLTSAIFKGRSQQLNSIHLSPKLFAHFWAWWSLFDVKTLPIRQGRRYKHKRPLSPKFGQHLATIKYRISVPKLFVSHAYMDNSCDAWQDGVTPFVGVKAKIGHFQADMHQRAQESTIKTPDGGSKTIMHKPFYGVEVVMKDLELRALLAIFPDPLKESVPLESSSWGKAYRAREDIPVIPADSIWVDLDDFVETDWSSEEAPTLHLLPAVSCPRFTYFRRAWDKHVSGDRIDVSKFGNEDTHVCLLGTEASVPQVQIELAETRIAELQGVLREEKRSSASSGYESKKSSDARKMLTLLQDYVKHLEKIDAAAQTSKKGDRQSYYMPSDSVSPHEWAEFSNVYQVHCPQLFMDNTIRDILLQYYYCSRARRGLEYHMATRAVKFIRDQAAMAAVNNQDHIEKEARPPNGAQAAAMAVRKMFTGETGTHPAVESMPASDFVDGIDPMSGWSEGVSLQKSHFCLLLKPQIVLKSEADADAVTIMAAVQGKLQTYGIVDVTHADDPVSGTVLTRNFASLTGLQTFSPSSINKGEGFVPLEVLVDLRCDNSLFDRLVPQTDASFHYDKFNRLRLQNNITAVSRTSDHADPMHNHLQNQTDLIRFHVPRFTVSANDRHFQAISHIVTNLLLFSDAAHKIRSDRLEKMLFSYDFTDLSSAADVVASLQARLRHAVELKQEAERKLKGFGEDGEREKLAIEAHVILLAEELDLVFDAIRLAQEKVEGHAGQKSALLLHASSSEISYRMLDRKDQLLAKLAVRDIDFYWLHRQDGSTVNNLTVGDLQAFDGSADAEWTEILSKYDEKSNHPLVKQNLFLLADWTVLPPVGGIIIYEAFQLTLHPMRLQIDTRVGRKIMEYVWPARRARNKTANSGDNDNPRNSPTSPTGLLSPRRNSTDVLPSTRKSLDSNRLVPPAMRRVHTSRSFTDLRNTARQDSLQPPRTLQRTKSSDFLFAGVSSSGIGSGNDEGRERGALSRRETDDAMEMKYRSNQKTFIWVRIASLHLLLSIQKENSFLCRDARIRTRDLEYRNQTWSFEELVDQFIPSGRNWKGWVKMAFNQPLVPVLPVARELISKTKWGAKGHGTHTPKRKGTTPKLLPFMNFGHHDKPEDSTSENSHDKGKTPMYSTENLSELGLTTDPEPLTAVPTERAKQRSRPRVLSLFKRSHSKVHGSVDSDVSTSTTSSVSSIPPLPDRPSIHHTDSSSSAYSRDTEESI
ncbi:hypothetical protein K474DRAFT_1133165 [Panus rudis PR-1116 ss-1]|nr:hypothetical protein K474DRAFT_1133165 [Panus rudis PR-1116 ss-1]